MPDFYVRVHRAVKFIAVEFDGTYTDMYGSKSFFTLKKTLSD